MFGRRQENLCLRRRRKRWSACEEAVCVTCCCPALLCDELFGSLGGQRALCLRFGAGHLTKWEQMKPEVLMCLTSDTVEVSAHVRAPQSGSGSLPSDFVPKKKSFICFKWLHFQRVSLPLCTCQIRAACRVYARAKTSSAAPRGFS